MAETLSGFLSDQKGRDEKVARSRTEVLEDSRTITLNEAEQRLAKYLATKRYECNRQNGVTNLKVGKQDFDATELDGIAGEIAFCKYQNIYPDLSIGPRHRGADCEHGLMIDVKTTRCITGRLMAMKCREVNDVDAYALMVGSFPTYRFAGWCRADELVAPENVRDLGYGDTYVREQARLRKDFRFEAGNTSIGGE